MKLTPLFISLCLPGTALAPLNNKYYTAQMAKSPTGRAPPEARLPFACLGSIMLPVGIFWFAWTSDPSIHWIAPILAGVPFGCGMLLVFTSVIGESINEGNETRRNLPELI